MIYSWAIAESVRFTLVVKIAFPKNKKQKTQK